MFACANPAPEIWPDAARSAGARIVATGRSDFPNQLNNSLVFPGLFRGVLDVRARTISNNMAIAAAEELVAFARRRGLRADQLLPSMTDWTAAAGVAAAAGAAAVTEGLARNPLKREQLERLALDAIGQSRAAVAQLIEAGLIARPPQCCLAGFMGIRRVLEPLGLLAAVHGFIRAQSVREGRGSARRIEGV